MFFSEPFVELDMDENRTVWKLYIPKGDDFETIAFQSKEQAEEAANMLRVR
tara:strand:- start:168 stop:320 length:153 start_codon:yes stop_codon:yes gene_type:complete